MITTNRGEIAGRLRVLRDQGQSEKYVHAAIGYNYRMTDIQAALGRGQLRRLSRWTALRRRNGEYLRGALGNTSRLEVQAVQAGTEHAYHQFSVMLHASIDRARFIDDLRAAGIGCAIHYPVPVHRQPAFRAVTGRVDLPVSESVAKTIVSLPVHPGVSQTDLEYVADRVLHLVEQS